MAANDLHTVVVNMGAYTGSDDHPLIYIPDKAGAITVLDVQVSGIGAGTSIGLLLTSLTDVGTPAVDGTVATFGGTLTYAEGVVFEATVGDPDVQPGKWLGVKQTSGTAPASTWIVVNYVFGL